VQGAGFSSGLKKELEFGKGGEALFRGARENSPL